MPPLTEVCSCPRPDCRLLAPMRCAGSLFRVTAFFLMVLASTHAFGVSLDPVSLDSFKVEGRFASVEGQLASVKELEKGFNKGLFIQVIEEGRRLLTIKQNAPIKGIIAVSLAYQGKFDEGAAMLNEAEAAGEPSASLYRLLFSALSFRSKGDIEKSVEICQKAIDAAQHPVACLFIAEGAYTRKDYARALDYAAKAIAIEPEMAPAHLVRGSAYLALRQIQAASDSLRQAIAKDPRDLRPRIVLGQANADLGNYHATAAIYRDVLKLKPELHGVREQLALALLASDEIDEALKESEILLKDKSDSTVAHLCAARAHAWHDRQQEALKHLDQVIALTPDASAAHYLMGLCQFAQGGLDKARQRFEHALKLATDKSRPEVALAVLDLYAGKRSEAATKIEQALAGPNHKDDGRIHFVLGLISLDAKRWKEAKAHFQQSEPFVVHLENDLIDWEHLYDAASDKVAAELSRGAILLAENFPTAALKCFREAQRLNSSDVIALYLGANAAARLLQFDDAIRQLDQLIDILPWFWPAHFASAQVYLSQRNFDRAISSFEEVIKLDAGNEPSYIRLIELYRRQGREDEVERVCRALVRNVPTSVVGLNELAVLLTDRRDQLDAALEAARKAVAIEPENGSCLDTLGWVHYQRGSFREAAKPLRKAAALSPQSPVIRYHLGAALVKAGHKEEGVGHLRQSIALAPDSMAAKLAEGLLEKSNTTGSVGR
jgi:tetratricopeptide (TPR) repeat protein